MPNIFVNVINYFISRNVNRIVGFSVLIYAENVVGPEVLKKLPGLLENLLVSLGPWGSLQWRHNEYNGVKITGLTIVYSTVFSRRRSKKTSKLRVTGLCVGNSPVTGEFPTQRASNAEKVSIWWRHHIGLTFGFIDLYLEWVYNSSAVPAWLGDLYPSDCKKLQFLYQCSTFCCHLQAVWGSTHFPGPPFTNMV